MRKNIIITLLLSLLALFPGLMLAQTLTSYEYWFDDDVDGLQTGTLSGTNDAVTIQADARGLSQGVHRLNFRARQSDGSYSAVTSSVFIKLAAGVGNKLEYWIDNDRRNVPILDGSLASDGKDYIFNRTLDLGDISPGYHRLYYRARSSSGGTASAVCMSPIIVKSRYYHDPNEEVNVEKYGIAVDDGAMEMFDVPNPRDTITQNHILDASHLSAGGHTVKATFWNSAGMSTSVEQAFNVTVPEEPSITLTAQQEGGLVKLHFNSVANDKGYRLYRTLGSGTPKIVDHKTGSIYPSDINYNDDPAAGTYKYQAWIPYTDSYGTSKVLKSNEVSVTVTQALSEEEAAAQYGTITGRIVCDKNMPGSGLIVRFSNDNQTVPVQGVLFSRDKMPQGTEVTLTVEGDELHEYEPVTVTVGEGVTDVTINGTLIEENQPNNQRRDLVMASDLEMVNDMDATYLKFTVKNLSQNHWWYGKVRVRAIDKKMADKAHLDLSEMEYGSHNMYKGESDDLRLKGNAEDGNGSATAEVTITLEDLHLDKDKDFYLYFESIGLWGGEGYTEEVKPINPNLHYNVDMNPMVWTIPRSETPQEQWDQHAREEYAYLILGLSSVMPGFDGQVGDLDPIRTKVMSITGKRNAREAAQALIDWIGDKSALEAINDPNLSNITSAVKDVVIDIHDAIHPPLVERYWANIVGSMSQAVPAGQMIDVFSEILTTVTSDDQFEQTMACSSLLLQAFAAAGSNPLPLVSVMHTYSVVGKALIDAVNRLADIENGRFIVHRLRQNREFTKTDELYPNRQNSAVDFKIIVKEAKWYGDKTINFTEDGMLQQIKNVCIKVAEKDGTVNDQPTLKDPATFTFTLVPLSDGVMLKTDGKGVSDGNIDDFNEIAAFYMEIHWRNGRVSYIPLIQPTDTDGIKFLHKNTNIEDDQDDFSETEPLVYIVTLTTETDKENMADEIYLGKNKKKE